jgi:tape measure domain-containing protein
MKFDNSAFERGVSTTIGTLTKLTDKLKLTGATKGLDDVQAKASRFNLNAMDGAVTGISKKFLALSTVAITALSNITNRAVNAGVNLVKSLTIAPIMDGFHEYETNMNSIQTILANTGLKGKSGLAQVNAALNDLNRYSDKTIYNFSEMARNIGTFTAAGVDLKTATASIKGIANLAAISGSNSQQASTAMYQLSQAISSGRVGLQDWNSVVNAGMGGKVFQTALARTAATMGTLGDNSVKTSGKMKKLTIDGKSFRESITAKPGQQSWLTSDVLTSTLKQFGGNMTAAQLKAQGFKDAQVKAILEMGKMGTEAATKVKTLSQLMSTLKEAVGSGWTKSFQTIFGNFNESRTLFTDVSNFLGKIISNSANARNKMLGDWKDLGGRTAAIDAIKNAFTALTSVMKPIHDAFREIFPATTGKQLFDLTVKIRDFMKSLEVGGTTANNIKRTFAGFFAVLDIGVQIVKAAIGGIAHLFGSFGKGSGSILNLTGNVGDFLVSLDQAIKKGGLLTSFFNGLASVLSLPIKLISAMAGVLTDLGSSFDLSGLVSKVAHAFKAVTDAITGAFSTDNVNASMSVFTAGITGGIFLVLKKFIGRITTLFDGGIFGGGGMLDSIKDTFQTLTGSLKAMQTQIQAKTLLLIAGALALLTASVVALSFVDGKALGKSLAAMTVAFTQLLGAMAVLVKISGSAGFVKVPLIAASMVLLSSSILILSAAIAVLGHLSWEQIAKGLTGIAGALVAIAGGMRLMPKGMVAQAAALTIIGVAINEIALAIAGLGMLSWESIAKGLVGIAGALVAVAAAMRMMPKGMVMQAAALTLVGTALDAIALAIMGMGQLSWDALAKGLTGVAGALLVIAGAMQLMPNNLPLTAAGLVLVSVALQGISLAVIGMGQLGWEAIAKGLTALAGAMAILAIGLNAMSTTLLGSAALVVAAAALALLTPALMALGTMSWEAIAKGLTVLAAALLIFAGAGILLAPAAIGLLALGGAIALFGVGLAAAGAGVLALSLAFKALVSIMPQIPGLFKALGDGIVALLGVVARSGTAIVKAFVTMFNSVLDAVIQVTPKIMKTINTMLDALLALLIRNVPKMVDAGMKLLLGILTGINNNITKIVNKGADIIVKFLNGVANNMGRVVTAGVNVIVKFLNGVANNMERIVTAGTNVVVKFINGVSNNLPRVINAGVNLVIKFINGVANAINSHSSELGAAGGRLAIAIVTGMAKGLASGVGTIASAAVSAAKSALNAAKSFLGIHSPSRKFRDEVGKPISDGMAKGIDDNSKKVSDSAVKAAKDSLDAVKKQKLPDEFKKIGQDLNHGFINGLTGSEADVRTTLSNMNDDLKAAVASTRKTVDDDRKHLKDLLDAKKQDADAIAKARSSLAQAEALESQAAKAHDSFVKRFADQKAKLIDLGKQYDTVAQQIQDAQKALDDAISTRDNAKASLTSQYAGLPDITADTTLSDYLAAVQTEADQTKAFLASLNTLTTMGLDDATYQKFLDEGIGIQPFIDQLVAAGPDAVKAVNATTDDLTAVATKLGKTASDHLYQAGVDAATGLLNGLKSKKQEIEDEMTKIAASIEKVLKLQLKIKSPSRVTEEIGRYVTEGLAQGIAKYSGSVDKSAGNMAQSAVNTLKDTMSQVSGTLGATKDFNPVVAPVLDLTQLQKDAGQIGSLMSSKAIAANVSYGQAASISANNGTSSGSAQAASATEVSPTVVKFEQNNYSPKALSPVEIYRQTRNQLSLAKEALSVS